MTASAHVAVLLAAGGSRRLGRAKQLLHRDGEPLLRRIARLLLDDGAVRVFVVLGARRDAMADALAGLDCRVLHNERWAEGVGGSVACAAQALRDHAGPVLIAGCDQPALGAAHLRALRGLAGNGWAAAAHGGTVGIPVVVPGPWFARTGTAMAAAADRGLGTTLRALPPGSLARLEAPELAFDLDTDADVRMAIARGWLDVDDVPAAATAGPAARLRPNSQDGGR